MDNPNFPNGRYTTMDALKETLNDKEVRRKVGRIMITTGVVMVSSSLYLKHRDVVNKAIKAQQDLAFESMWATFDSGVKYGLALAQEGVEDVKEVSNYGFGVFDRPA